MRHYDTSFFCDDGKAPEAHFYELTDCRSFVLAINGDPDNRYAKPSITIHLENEQAVINFKNSVLWAFEKFMREPS